MRLKDLLLTERVMVLVHDINEREFVRVLVNHYWYHVSEVVQVSTVCLKTKKCKWKYIRSCHIISNSISTPSLTLATRGLNKHLKSSWKRWNRRTHTHKTHTHTHTHIHYLLTHRLTHTHAHFPLCLTHQYIRITVTLASPHTLS